MDSDRSIRSSDTDRADRTDRGDPPDRRPLATRRELLGGVGVAVAGALAGCGEITSYEFRADAVTLPENARSELGYTERSRDAIEASRSRSVGGVNVDATIESHVATYESDWTMTDGDEQTILEAVAGGGDLTVARASELGVEAGDLGIAGGSALLDPEGALVLVPERARTDDWVDLSRTLVVTTGAAVESEELRATGEGYRVPAKACFPDDIWFPNDLLFTDDIWFPSEPLAPDREVAFFPDNSLFPNVQHFPDDPLFPDESFDPSDPFFPNDPLFPDETYFPNDPLASSPEHVILASGAAVFGARFAVRQDWSDAVGRVSHGIDPGQVFEDATGKVAHGINPGMVFYGGVLLADGAVEGVYVDGPCAIESDTYVPETPMALARVGDLFDVDDEALSQLRLSADTRLATFTTEEANEDLSEPFEAVAPGDELTVDGLAVLFPGELYYAAARAGPRVDASIMGGVSFPDCPYATDGTIFPDGDLTLASATPRAPTAMLSEAGRPVAAGNGGATLRLGALSTPEADVLGKSLNPLTETALQDLLTSDHAESFFGRVGVADADSSEWVRGPTPLRDDRATVVDADTVMESFAGVVRAGERHHAVFVHAARATVDGSVILAVGAHDRRVGSPEGPYVGDDGYVTEAQLESAVEAVLAADDRYEVEN